MRILKLFLGCILLAGFVFSSCIRPWRTTTSSMEPNIRVGDIVLVWPAGHYTYGDIIAFEIWRQEDILGNVQEGEKEYRTYRVVGLPGDTVEVKNNFCIVNGQAPQTRFIKDTTDKYGYPFALQEEILATGVKTRLLIEKSESTLNRDRTTLFDNSGPVIVPRNHYYVLGDNRANAADSRMIGAVPGEKIKGKVVKRK